MQMQRPNTCNHLSDPGPFMESPPPSKLFANDSLPSSMQPSSSTSSGGGGSSVGDGGLGYIEHTVSKFDTLVGVAIKYGVEVTDIKKMNGLTTDLQMFSRKTLQIPLPGRHPPSPIMANGHNFQGPKNSEVTAVNRRHSDMFDSIKSLKLSSSSPHNVSPSMDALRDYYGLKPNNHNGVGERFEMDTYQKGGAFSLEYGPKPSQSLNPPPGLHRKCKSLAYGLSEKGGMDSDLSVANGKEADSDKWFHKLIGRRKSEVDLQNHTPEMILKQDNSNGSSAFSAAAGKGLALRPKAASRTSSEAEGLQNMAPLKLGDSYISQTCSGVKKSSSTPSFLETDSNYNNSNNFMSTSSIWPTSVLNLTADLQALSTAAITRPIFDGLPKPMSGRKNKAAID